MLNQNYETTTVVNITKSSSLKEVLKHGEQCKRRGECCKHGSGFLVEKDLGLLAKFLKIGKEQLKEKYLDWVDVFNTKMFRPKLKSKTKLYGLIKKKMPYGQCMFYNEKNKDCKIHNAKPLQCKIAICGELGEKFSLWFMLNYQIKQTDPESIRQYATYLKCGGKTLLGGKLEEIVPDKKLLQKILSYEVLK